MVKPESGGQGQLDIYLDFEKGFKFVGGKTHDTVEHTWQHLNFFKHTCFLHARVPRVQSSDGSTRMFNVSWARSVSGFTLLFKAFSMLLIESEMPISKAADLMDLYPQRLWNVFCFWIKKVHRADFQAETTILCIDETSSKKGLSYVTVAVDMNEKRVIYAVPGKG